MKCDETFETCNKLILLRVCVCVSLRLQLSVVPFASVRHRILVLQT